MLTQPDQILYSRAVRARDYINFTRWYFDWTPLKNQYVGHIVKQPNIIHLGGVGSGKTMGQAMSFITNAMTIPHYKGLNTSISSFQAKLMYDMLVPYITQPKVECFIKDMKTRPYPTIETHIGGLLAFMTAGYQAQLIRGSEWDEINGDEFGYERDEETMFALRGRLRGTRPNNVVRKAQLRVTTTPTDSEWLRRWWDRGDTDSGSEELDLNRYCSLRSTLFDNIHIPEWQQVEIMAGYTEEMVQQEIYALFPDWGDTEISARFIDACEDRWLNHHMEEMINPIVVDEGGNETAGTPTPGADYIELPRVGCVKWEAPCERGRYYILASDPGTASPPKRNSPVVMVWDVTERPFKLVYLDWVSGNGSYMPWFHSFKYALSKYNPLIRGIDATGPQKAIDELVFEREGIPLDSVNFARDKGAMLNGLKLLFQNHELAFPYIKGLRHQLRTYRFDDKDLAQDLVACMMVFSYLTRFMAREPERKQTLRVMTAAHQQRRLRSRRSNTRSRRRS